jgi:hypothetical protein
MKHVHWSGSLKEVERKLAKYRLDLMVVQKVRWDKGEAECVEKCTLFCGKEMKIVSREQDICKYRRVGE